METVRLLLLCTEMDNLAFFMENHNLWSQLLGAARWRNGLHSLIKYGPKPLRVLPHTVPHSASYGALCAAPRAALLK